MKLSPLQLRHYHFVKLCLEARADIELVSREVANELYPPVHDVDLNPEVSLARFEDDPDAKDFALTLSVTNNKEPGESFPYLFNAIIEGLFTIDHQGDPEERERLVVINGASILFGAIREQLLTLSLRHRYGPMLLPCLNFRGLQLDTSTPSEGS